MIIRVVAVDLGNTVLSGKKRSQNKVRTKSLRLPSDETEGFEMGPETAEEEHTEVQNMMYVLPKQKREELLTFTLYDGGYKHKRDGDCLGSGSSRPCLLPPMRHSCIGH